MRSLAPGTLRTRAARQIDADPTSTALLLAGPTALDLWPGVRRVGEAGGRVLVEARLRDVSRTPDDPVTTAATVRALPPKRTPTSYITKFAWTGPSLPVTTGELVLSYAPGSNGPATMAVLVLDSVDVQVSALREHDLQEMSAGFLDNLARAAEDRSRAA